MTTADLGPGWRFERGATIHEVHTDSGEIISYAASDLEKQRTGVHGLMKVSLGDHVLVWGRMNLDRAEDRVRLVGYMTKGVKGTALELLSLDGEQIQRERMQHDFDRFCMGVFDEFLKQNSAQFVMGDTNSSLDFIAKPHVLNEGGTILYGPPGSGKTYVGLVLAVSVHHGLNTIWEISRPRVTLFINLERGKSGIARRLGFVNRALGMEDANPLLMINARGKTLNEIRDIIERSVELHHVEFVILDSISRSGQGGLTEDSAVNKMMDMLNAICPSWFALAHTPRQDATHVFGSIHFDAAADLMIRMSTQKTNTSMGIGLTVTKTNDTAEPPQMVLGFDFKDEALDSVYEGTLRLFPDLVVGDRSPGLAEEIADLFSTEMTNGTATEIARKLNKGRPIVSKVLFNDDRFTRVRSEGRNIYYGLKSDEGFSRMQS